LDDLGIKPVKDSGEQPLFSWHAILVRINHRKTGGKPAEPEMEMEHYN
jgi:hypothetical protein